MEKADMEVVHLTPDQVLADDNIRWGLRQPRIDELADSILEAGEVLSPIEVQEMEKAQGKAKYRLTSGFYRHAAVTKLNKDNGAGLTLPAIVRNVDDKVRLSHQIAENRQREQMSPMDEAVAIKRMMDAGVPRIEIRRIFARPTGRKGQPNGPASNAWVNVTLRLLDLPKTIQEKIHDGSVSFAAAYELGRVSPDKRQAVLKRAEEMRAGELEKEASDEKRYLADESKLAEQEDTAKKALSEVEQAKADVEAAKAAVQAKRDILSEIKKTPYLDLEKSEREKIVEKMKAAESDVKAADKLWKDASNKVAKLLDTAKVAEDKAQTLKERLENARKAKAGAKKKQAVGPKDVQKAAQEAGEKKYVPLNISDVRQGIKDLTKEKHVMVAAIGEAMKRFVDGETTPKQLAEELAAACTPKAAEPKKK